MLNKIKENYWLEPKYNCMSTRIEDGNPCSNDGYESYTIMLKGLESGHDASLTMDFLNKLDDHVQARSMVVDNFRGRC